MKKTLLPISTFFLASLFLLLYLLNGVIKVFPDCVYYNSEGNEPVYLVGKVTGIQEKENWIVSSLELCDDSLFTVAKVKIYTPKDEGLFDVGEELVHEGTEAYQWNKVSIDIFDSVANKNNLLAVRVEELKSEEAVLALFEGFEDFDCENRVICRNRIGFVRRHGPSQTSFLNNLKNKNIIPLFLDFITGEAVVYSKDFGKVDSVERFRQLTDGLLI